MKALGWECATHALVKRYLPLLRRGATRESIAADATTHRDKRAICTRAELTKLHEKQSTVFFAMYIDGIQIVAVEESSQEAASSDVSSILWGREAQRPRGDLC